MTIFFNMSFHGTLSFRASLITMTQPFYQRRRVPLTHFFSALLQVCDEFQDLKTGCKVHAHITKTSLLKADLFLGKCGLLKRAHELFNSRNNNTLNALIARHVQHEHGAEAWHQSL